jgi:hypothetical protein
MPVSRIKATPGAIFQDKDLLMPLPAAANLAFSFGESFFRYAGRMI